MPALPIPFLSSRFRSGAALLTGVLLAPAWAQHAPAPPDDAVVYERVVSRPVNAEEAAAEAPATPAAAPKAHPGVRLHQQDAGSSVEELRVRGQTQTITVTPAGTMPAYEVRPGGSQAFQSLPSRAADGTNGPRRWKIGEF